MKFLKIISLIIKVVILLVLFILAAMNVQHVNFSYLPGQAQSLPLIVILLGSFIVGAIFGVFAMFGRLLRLRSENNRLRQEVQKTARLTTKDITAPAEQTMPAITEQK